MRAVIMAGGKGTRIQSVVKDIPKPMISIMGKPILEYQIESLKRSNIREITLIVGCLGNVIIDYFGDGSKWNVQIDYIIEEEPLGTGGALFFLKGKINGDFVLLFGDLILDVDWKRFMNFHQEKRGAITLYGHPNAHPFDSDVIVSNSESKVLDVLPKNLVRNFYYRNFVNAGIYCVNSKVVNLINEPKRVDFEKDVISKLVSRGEVFAYRSTEYVKDMGTPDRLQSVAVDVRNGVVESRNLKRKQKAIFMDRDGTINVLKGFLNNVEEFELIACSAEGIKKINMSNYLAIVITNQPVVARGECTFEILEQIHRKMETELGRQGAYIDDLFFCPHHPHKGYKGEISELKIDCDCRKPKVGLLKQAAEKYNIDLKQSWYIGDTSTDIMTGVNAGMRTVLVKTGEAGKDGKYDVSPDYVTDNLFAAVDYILTI